jgi:spore germination cell wall hydrolase CwlJ-like protein
MNPVTDPAILAQLNGEAPATSTAPTQGLSPVTDPAVLRELNGEGPADTRNIVTRTVDAIDSVPDRIANAVDSVPSAAGHALVGVGGKLLEQGVGVLQAGSSGLNKIGVVSDEGNRRWQEASRLAVDEIRGDLKTNKEAAPIAATVGEFAGEALPYVAVPGGATAWGRAGLGAGTGLVTGLTEGQGTGENGNRFESGVIQGAIGGVATPVLYGAGEGLLKAGAQAVQDVASGGLRQVLPSAGRVVASPVTGVAREAGRLVVEPVSAVANRVAPETTRTITNAISEARSANANPEGFVGDVLNRSVSKRDEAIASLEANITKSRDANFFRQGVTGEQQVGINTAQASQDPGLIKLSEGLSADRASPVATFRGEQLRGASELVDEITANRAQDAYGFGKMVNDVRFKSVENANKLTKQAYKTLNELVPETEQAPVRNFSAALADSRARGAAPGTAETAIGNELRQYLGSQKKAQAFLNEMKDQFSGTYTTLRDIKNVRSDLMAQAQQAGSGLTPDKQRAAALNVLVRELTKDYEAAYAKVGPEALRQARGASRQEKILTGRLNQLLGQYKGDFENHTQAGRQLIASMKEGQQNPKLWTTFWDKADPAQKESLGNYFMAQALDERGELSPRLLSGVVNKTDPQILKRIFGDVPHAKRVAQISELLDLQRGVDNAGKLVGSQTAQRQATFIQTNDLMQSAVNAAVRKLPIAGDLAGSLYQWAENTYTKKAIRDQILIKAMTDPEYALALLKKQSTPKLAQGTAEAIEAAANISGRATVNQNMAKPDSNVQKAIGLMKQLSLDLGDQSGAVQLPGQSFPVRAPSAPAGASTIVTSPANYTPRDFDAVVRTIWGEARGESAEGQAAVANVIKNRLSTGRWGGRLESVVKAKSQFEPWGNPDTRAAMLALSPDSPEYQQIAVIARQVLDGQAPDITNGATHFVAPQAQGALGRNMPAWAKEPIATVGGHTFYAPEGRAGLPMDQASRMARAQEQGFDTATPVYHGTDGRSYESIMRNGFDNEKSADGGTWFTTSKAAIDGGEVGAAGNGKTIEAVLRGKKWANYDDVDKYTDDELVQMGYSGYRLDDGDQVTFKVFNPSDVRSPDAAFDPTQTNSSNLLAGLGIGAAGAAAISGRDALAADLEAAPEAAKTFSQTLGDLEDDELLAVVEGKNVRQRQQAMSELEKRYPGVGASKVLDIARAASNVNVDPTDGQKQAGNYKKGRFNLNGLKISIENPIGSKRSGKDADGKPWSVDMENAHYGYLRGTIGADGDHLDVYIGPDTDSKDVYVVDQIDPNTGKFDETKSLIGFNSENKAMQAYEKAFSDGSGKLRIGAVKKLSIGEFKKWSRSGKSKKAISYV